MASDDTTRPEAVAVEQLEALGLSTYAAQTYVTLVALEDGTARDVSEASDVPRTRVYDAIEELHNRGLVDVQHSRPKRFWPVSTETAGRHFQNRYTHRVETLQESLDIVQTTRPADGQPGVWTVTDQDAITERVVDFVDTAEEEVVFMTIGDLLDDEIADSLSAASDRGAEVRLAEMSDDVESELYDRVPAAQSFDSLWNWDQTPTGRLLMIDRERTLVSVLVGNDNPDSAADRDETAIWGAGPSNGLVVVLRAMFTWQLDDIET